MLCRLEVQNDLKKEALDCTVNGHVVVVSVCLSMTVEIFYGYDFVLFFWDSLPIY